MSHVLQQGSRQHQRSHPAKRQHRPLASATPGGPSQQQSQLESMCLQCVSTELHAGMRLRLPLSLTACLDEGLPASHGGRDNSSSNRTIGTPGRSCAERVDYTLHVTVSWHRPDGLHKPVQPVHVGPKLISSYLDWISHMCPSARIFSIFDRKTSWTAMYRMLHWGEQTFAYNTPLQTEVVASVYIRRGGNIWDIFIHLTTQIACTILFNSAVGGACFINIRSWLRSPSEQDQGLNVPVGDFGSVD
eukprot:3186758-Amphidinium_carterae.1